MLQAIRERASGWIAYVIVGLLIIPFALWGVNSYLGDPPLIDAAQVGDSTVSVREFQQAYQRRLQNLQNMLGEAFDPSLINENSIKNEVLEQLVNDKVLSLTARRQGIWVGDKQLHETIRSFEAFQQNGQFDRDRYDRLLSLQGMTPISFEESLRSSLLSSQLREGLVASALLTQADIDSLIRLFTQKREIAYLVLHIEDYLDKVTVDEDAVEAYFEENKNRFLSPEQVKIRYLELELEQLADDVVINDDELLQAYEEQISKYSVSEERYASHVLVGSAPEDDNASREEARARAQGIYSEIQSGAKSFEDALTEAQAPNAVGLEAGELGLITEGMFDSAFDDTLYTLKKVGDISEPVQTPFGFHIIRLDKLVPGKVQPFAEVKEEVARQLKLRRAEAQFYDAAELLANLTFEQPDSLESAAQALELEISESDWFSRQRGDGIAAYPKVIDAAFSDEVLNNGYNSAPIEIEPSHVVVLRVEEHQKAKPLSLEEAREEIVEQLRKNKAEELLITDIGAMRQQVEQGESLAKLAAEYGGDLQTPGLVERNDVNVNNAVSAEAFQLPHPSENAASVGIASLGGGDQALIVVQDVVPGDVKDLQEAERAALIQRLEQQIGAAQFASFLASQRQQIDVVTYTDRL